MLTVLIATHNGARTMGQTLESLCGVASPEGGWKLVIVDNASMDDTANVIRSFAGRLPLAPLFLDTPGQNRARNRGLALVEGDLVLLTDDDVIPRADWLIQLRSAADAHPEFGIFGGQILPRWEVQPAPWILDSVPLAPCFALTDASWEEGPCKSDFVFSGNMALRMEIFRAGYRFDEAVGPRPGSYAMGSETELTRRLSAAGIRAWHAHGAIVEHLIRAHQIEPEWALARAVRYGRGQYRWSLADTKPAPAPLVTAVRLGRGILATSARIAAAKWRGDRRRVLRSRWDRNRLLGTLAEALRVRSERLFRPFRRR